MQRHTSDLQRRRASDALLLSSIAIAVIVGKVISAGLSPVHPSQAEFSAIDLTQPPHELPQGDTERANDGGLTAGDAPVESAACPAAAPAPSR